MISLDFKVDLQMIQCVLRIKKINDNAYTDDFLFSESYKTKNAMENQWATYKKVVIEILKELLTHLVDEERIIVYAFPQAISIGACHCEDKKILLGHKEEYDNFYLVTLSHEITHILNYSFRKNNQISRITDEIIAFLIAEGEIRKRINGTPYFNAFFSGPLSILHKTALDFSINNISFWRNYLKTPHKQIIKVFEYFEKLTKNIDLNKLQLKDLIN